ncbi:MAG: alginate export family protein [Flammeovirgaceae bacterium]
MRWQTVIQLFSYFWLTTSICAQSDREPSFQLLRANEDYQYLAGQEDKTTWERLKYISIGKGNLSIGGNIRSEFQYLLNEGWEKGNDDKGLLFQRFMLHADWHLTKKIRVFTQLKNGFTIDRNGEKSPLDTDHLDFHQLFVDFNLGKHQLSVGRQELWYGSRRLISIREGTNIRQSFDGVRWKWQDKQHQLDALYFYYNPQRIGWFDNDLNTDSMLWGGYYVWVNPLNKLNLDVYYLGVRNKHTAFEAGTDREVRHSVGARLWKKTGRFQYNTEFVYQFGDFGNHTIQAWTASTEINYQLSETGLKPTLGFKGELISGDSDETDRTLGTFNPLYPRGGYFGLLALIGPANLMDLHPSLALSLGDKWKLNMDWDIFWRYSERDGIYFPSGRLNIPSNQSTHRFIGHQAGIQISYEFSPFVALETSCFYFDTGRFLNEVTAGANLLQLGFSANIQF